jgi:hypothetical protein
MYNIGACQSASLCKGTIRQADTMLICCALGAPYVQFAELRNSFYTIGWLTPTKIVQEIGEYFTISACFLACVPSLPVLASLMLGLLSGTMSLLVCGALPSYLRAALLLLV